MANFFLQDGKVSYFETTKNLTEVMFILLLRNLSSFQPYI